MADLQARAVDLNRLLKNETYSLPATELFSLDPVIKFIFDENQFCINIQNYKLSGNDESVGLAYGINMFHEIGSLAFMEKLKEIPQFKERVPDDVDYKWLSDNFLYKNVDVEIKR